MFSEQALSGFADPSVSFYPIQVSFVLIHQIQDFLDAGGATTSKVGAITDYFGHFSPKTTWNWRHEKVDWEGGAQGTLAACVTPRTLHCSLLLRVYLCLYLAASFLILFLCCLFSFSSCTKLIVSGWGLIYASDGNICDHGCTKMTS